MTDVGFWRVAAADPDRIAIVDSDGASWTAGALLARANQVANGLVAAGLEPGDSLAVVQPNRIEMFELYLGALQVGVRITPINHHLAAPEIAYIINDCEAEVFVGHERFADMLEVARSEFTGLSPERVFAVGTVEGFRPYSELTEGQPSDAPPMRTTGAAMHYTSGTTGRPKGVKRALFEIDPDDMAALLTGFQAMFGIEAGGDGVYLSSSPLYHTAPLMWCGSALHMGDLVVLMDKFEPVRTMELIDEHRVTWSHMVPTQLTRILRAVPAEERDRYDVSSLRTMVHAAAPCPREVKREMIEWWGDAIVEYYAATEGGGTMITAAEWLRRPGSVGRAWPTSEVRILDDDRREVPAGVEGTVYLSLAMADFEYSGDAAKTAANRIDGFFTVGDWGLLDEDGYLYLLDRKSDMIISGGVNIYPAEIEGVMIGAPGVADVAVFGIPHDEWGEEIKAVVQLAAGVEPDDAAREAIMAYLSTRLGSFTQPRSIDFVEALPRDPSGKLFKRRFRDPYWQGRDQRI